MAKVLVTGGCGFIGRHLCAALLGRSHEVIILGRPRDRRRTLKVADKSVPVLPIDMHDRAAMDALFDAISIDQIYHLAAQTRRTPQSDLRDVAESADEDLVGLLVLLGAAASAARPPASFVRTGTIAEYGSCAVPFREEMRERPVSTYGAALVAGTTYLETTKPRRPFPAVTARLALVYGPGQSTDFLMARLLHDLPRGCPVRIAHPQDRRDMIHVDDAVAAMLRLGEGVEGIVNIGTGVAPSMSEIVRAVLQATGADPALVTFGRPTDSSGSPELRCDPSRARELIGWSAGISLEAGIQRTLAGMSTRPNTESFQ